MRTLLVLVRENRAAVQDAAVTCLDFIDEAMEYLEILDPVRGDKELIKALAVELASLRRG